MALSSLNRGKKRDSVIAIDLGTRTTKAVHFQRRGETYTLSRYAILDAPIYEKAFSSDLLAEHLRGIVQALDVAKARQITLSIGVTDSMLRNAELPQMAASELRQLLKFNTKTYLQQELPDYVFDCFIVPNRTAPPEGSRAMPKFKVWVGGAKASLISDLQTAIRNAALLPHQVTLGALGPVNCFEIAHPETFAKEVVALVDVGFKTSTINVVAEGDLVLSRVVGIGGDKLTAGLAESMGISYAEAEGIKIGMPSEVEGALQPLISSLGRELRASIDFFEHQQDKTVGQIFISGGAARSEFIVQQLQSELLAPSRSWNPLSSLNLALPPQQMGEVEQIAPQLTTAIGAAAASF